jgi:hypothetical protein
MASTHWCNEIGNLRCCDASQARSIWHESSLGDFEAAGGDDQSSGTAHEVNCGPGMFFSDLFWIVEPNFNRLVTDFLVDLDMPCGFGGWESA